MAVQRAGVIELRNDVTVVRHRASRAHATLQYHRRTWTRVHGEVPSVPLVVHVAIVLGESRVVVDLADFSRIEIVQPGNNVTSTIRQIRVHRGRDAIRVVVRGEYEE